MATVQIRSTNQPGAIQRSLVLLYGVLVYLLFFATFLYLIGFVGNFFVPKSMDVGSTLPFAQALSINLALIVLFAAQHSVMARPEFKQWITKFIPESAERSTFVLATVIVLVLLFALWKPMGAALWDLSGTLYGNVLVGVSLLGWAIVLLATFMINHFDLFGLRQVYLQFRGKEYEPVQFQAPAFYRFVRHPLYFGFAVAFWATPVMTVAHLVFAVGMTLYMLGAIRLEERDLVKYHGEAYEQYRRRTSMIIPWIAKK